MSSSDPRTVVRGPLRSEPREPARLIAGLLAAWLTGWTVATTGCGSGPCESGPRRPGVTEASGADARPGDALSPHESRDWSAAGPREPAAFVDGYYLPTCAACGGLLGAKGESVDREHAGRPVRFCGPLCAAAFDADPGPVLRSLDQAVIADQSPYYPLVTSLVTGGPLGPDPVNVVWGNRLFRAADAAEAAEILADPARYVPRLDRAVIAAQAATYGMPDKCPVQGDILPSDTPIDLVIANRMVRVCCWRCVRTVRARPYQYLAMVDYANRAAAARRNASPDPAPAPPDQPDAGPPRPGA